METKLLDETMAPVAVAGKAMDEEFHAEALIAAMGDEFHCTKPTDHFGDSIVGELHRDAVRILLAEVQKIAQELSDVATFMALSVDDLMKLKRWEKAKRRVASKELQLWKRKLMVRELSNSSGNGSGGVGSN